MEIKKTIRESLALQQALLEDDKFIESLQSAAHIMITALNSAGRVMLCGNGGSAADAQHIAAELSGRFNYDRKPLDAEALHVNTSYITAVANDYSFNDIYARKLEASGRKGDVLIGISTSGNSENVLRAMQVAKDIGIQTIALTGKEGGKMADMADLLIAVPSKDTPRIQEAHILAGHILCQQVEKEIFPQKNRY